MKTYNSNSQNQALPQLQKKGSFNQQNSKNPQQGSARRSMGNVPFGNQNYNQRDVLNNFSQKLDKHQDEIDARNMVISEMEKNIELLKKEYISEKKKNQEKDGYIQQLQTAYQQLEGKHKQTYIKMEEMQTKIIHYERQITKMNENMESDVQKKQIQEENLKLQNVVVELQSLLEVKGFEIQSIQQKNDEITENMKKLQAEYDSTRSQNAGKGEEVRRLSVLQIAADKQQQSLREQFEALQKKNLELVKKNEQSKEAFEDKIRVLEKQVLQHKTNASIEESIQKRYELVQEELKEKLQLISDLQVSALQGKRDQERVVKLEQELLQLKQNMEQKLKEAIKDIRSQKEVEILQLKSTIDNLEEKIRVQKGELVVSELEKSKIEKFSKHLKQKDAEIRKNIDIIDKNEKEIMKSIKCNHCQKLIKEPVTIIPCGHNFCFECKTAYTKQCIKCGPKVKIEAMYRNELLDDIIQMVKILQNTKECMKQLTQ